MVNGQRYAVLCSEHLIQSILADIHVHFLHNDYLFSRKKHNDYLSLHSHIAIAI